MDCMIRRILHPTIVALPPGTKIRRTPPRPAEVRDENYESEFDFSTVFFDVFENTDRVILTGPPLENLSPILRGITLKVDGTAIESPAQTERLNRSQITWFDLPASRGSKIEVEINWSFLDPSIQKVSVLSVESDTNLPFQDKRCLMTLQKDNEITWIRDWATFYNKIHLVDSIVIFDNNSKEYSHEALLNEVASVPGIRNVVVVPWNFPYGPLVMPGSGANWDSDYTQIGAFLDASHRFFKLSKGFINADIDEFIFPLNNKDLFKELETSEHDALGIRGIHIESHLSRRSGNSNHPVRHFDFFESKTNAPIGARKWIGNPKSWGIEANPTQHYVDRINFEYTEDFSIGHFRGISNGWRYSSRTQLDKDTQNLEINFGMLQALAKAFPQFFSRQTLLDALREASQRQVKQQHEITEKLRKLESSDLQFFPHDPELVHLLAEVNERTKEFASWTRTWIFQNRKLVFEVSTPTANFAFDIDSNNDLEVSIIVRSGQLPQSTLDNLKDSPFLVSEPHSTTRIFARKNRQCSFEGSVNSITETLLDLYNRLVTPNN